MLVITRKNNQEVVIGNCLKPDEKPYGIVRVLEVDGDLVKLGFDFPNDIIINRRENIRGTNGAGGNPENTNKSYYGIDGSAYD
jgi:carbon storage regulator CsrA